MAHKVGRSVLLASAIMSAATAIALAQAATPAFEVASVKLSAPITDGKVMVSMGGDPGRINYSGLPLRMLIARAYNVKEYQVSGLDGFGTERYDVTAKLPPDTPRDQVPLMLQNLLAERFKLKLHREQKEMPVYAIVVGKGGVKMKEVEPAPGGNRQVNINRGKLDLPKSPISALADILSRVLDRPVLDMSESKASYDIALEFTPDESTMGGMGGMGMKMRMAGPGPGPAADHANAEGAAAPNIFTAIQEQLGLKLESRKAPVEILVVDHAEKVPTEN
jgi:uncharacterized protein (TIGR03435 family)